MACGLCVVVLAACGYSLCIPLAPPRFPSRPPSPAAPCPQVPCAQHPGGHHLLRLGVRGGGGGGHAQSKQPGEVRPAEREAEEAR